ncbi:hypothetical protein VV01_00335 [Luteipulveratus halotolerans]|uniref:Uncharacterized protein n=1 Tax=Luteipulveratus halotolerans TaxID=1631356 RepID=A0A0L6CPM2_9MICO|nr:hypothetical protein VV01_00080 [Luteipulveratus halotolerans]KNX39714.1 hypothetical protein VV01_00335 [Luteipulveratus halotolerans]
MGQNDGRRPQHQLPTNQDWPSDARLERIGYAPHPIDVTARVEWPDGTHQHVAAKAVRWLGERVHVTWRDYARCGGTVNVWLNARDVQRRPRVP